jgi:hypothetical protein
VFGRPALEGEITVPDLNVEYVSSKNLYRYSSGQYMKRSEAQAQLGKIRSSGYEDAFITAYFKGRKISLAEAENKSFNPQKNESPVASPSSIKDKSSAINTSDRIIEEPGKIYEFTLSDLYGTYTCCEESKGICNNPDSRNAVKRMTLISNGSGVAIDGNNMTKNFNWKFVKDSPNPIQGMEDILGENYPFYFKDGKIHLGQYCKTIE